MTRAIVTLHGRVQGVGFREHVIEIARRHPVAGTVSNLQTARELEIDVEVEAASVLRFIEDVLQNPPAFAGIEGVRREEAVPLGRRGFVRGATRR